MSHPLQLLGHQPTPEPAAGVILGSLNENLAEPLVQAGAALPFLVGRLGGMVIHAVEISGRRSLGAPSHRASGAERPVRSLGPWFRVWRPSGVLVQGAG